MHALVPGIDIESPRTVAEWHKQGLPIYVYGTAEDMGMASAMNLASEQIRLTRQDGATSILVMAAPSAFPFYRAYARLAHESEALREALATTHFFQFDEYALPPDHPATFRALLNQHFFHEIRDWCPPENVHFLDTHADDMAAERRRYAELVLEHGPELQLKGVGENGHWGFHEPGIPLDAAAEYIAVELSGENTQQQLRDHPGLFPTPDSVPKTAYTANVPLFMTTKYLIEDNVPQSSKAFALLAAYGSGIVDERVPSSALKRHPSAVVRITRDAAWALDEYYGRGEVNHDLLNRLARSFAAGDSESDSRIAWMRETLRIMQIPLAD